MSKPNGIVLGLTNNGEISLRVTTSDRATDMIYEAVEEALMAGMTASRFLSTVSEAWDDESDAKAKHSKWEFKEAAKNHGQRR